MNRKFPCVKENGDDNDIKNINSSNVHQNIPKITETAPKITEITPNIIINNSLMCKTCLKIFSRLSSLNRHINENRCKAKQLLDQQKENKEKIIDMLLLEEKIKKTFESEYKKKIEELEIKKIEDIENKKRIEELEKTVLNLQSKLMKVQTKNVNKGNITNNNINNNISNTNNGIVNNITVVKFGNEDYNKLNMDEILAIINKGSCAIQETIKMMHFNPRLPEYHNMYISDRKMNKALAFNGEQFSLVNTNDLLTNLIENKLDIIDKIKDKSGYSEEQLNNIIVLIDKLNDDTIEQGVKELYKKIKEDIKNILYNRKKVVINTHDKLIKNNSNIIDL